MRHPERNVVVANVTPSGPKPRWCPCVIDYGHGSRRSQRLHIAALTEVKNDATQKGVASMSVAFTSIYQIRACMLELLRAMKR